MEEQGESSEAMCDNSEGDTYISDAPWIVYYFSVLVPGNIYDSLSTINKILRDSFFDVTGILQHFSSCLYFILSKCLDPVLLFALVKALLFVM